MQTEGILVAGGHGRGISLIQLFHPRGVIVDEMDNVYVADSENYRLMYWLKGSKEGYIVVGGNGDGKESD